MKQKILEKSNELFLNLGFKSVTMDEIANALGVSKKTIYKYFTNKTDLVDAVTNFMFCIIRESIEEIRDRKLNPINELFYIKKIVSEHLKDEKSSPFYQLQKYYPRIHNSLNQKQFNLIQEIIHDNLERGIISGLYRKSIDKDFMTRIYFIGMVGIKDQDVFPLKKYSMNTLTNYYLDYHLRAISTEKGIQQLENQLIKE